MHAPHHRPREEVYKKRRRSSASTPSSSICDASSASRMTAGTSMSNVVMYGFRRSMRQDASSADSSSFSDSKSLGDAFLRQLRQFVVDVWSVDLQRQQWQREREQWLPSGSYKSMARSSVIYGDGSSAKNILGSVVHPQKGKEGESAATLRHASRREGIRW